MHFIEHIFHAYYTEIIAKSSNAHNFMFNIRCSIMNIVVRIETLT